MSSASPSASAVVLFDGVCNLCNASVNFIIDHDPEGYFKFAALQSPAAAALLAEHGRAESAIDPQSVLLIEGGRLYERSSAALRIARKLSGPWRLAYAAIMIPTALRDWGYRAIAASRYRLFGKSDVCRMPTPELKQRFL